MKTLLAALLVTASASATAQYLEPISPPAPIIGMPDSGYRSHTGAQYQYDLNRPVDALRYDVDPRAQQRDSLSVDPRRDLDRGMGQRGGGIRR